MAQIDPATLMDRNTHKKGCPAHRVELFERTGADGVLSCVLRCGDCGEQVIWRDKTSEQVIRGLSRKEPTNA